VRAKDKTYRTPKDRDDVNRRDEKMFASVMVEYVLLKGPQLSFEKGKKRKKYILVEK
jgi:hypothetical protein